MSEWTLSLHDLLLTICLIGAWSVIAINAALAVAGYVYSIVSERTRKTLPEPAEWPGISVIIPAHNEEIVMAGTIESVLHLDYPRDKIEILVVDDSSTDLTRRIVDELMGADRRVKLVAIPPGLGGKGKSHALNVGLRYAKHDLIAVYDADNSPEPQAIRYLVAELLADPKLAATVGKVRTLNHYTNFLTRCIAIEFMSFQWIIQGGRWLLFHLSSLPGTNYVIRREALERAGSWDPGAIADDAELTVRLQQEGYHIKFVPYAVTWEPEPQDWGVWMRQRLRWARGGTYVVRKFFPRLHRIRSRDLFLEVMHLLTIYHVFFAVLLLSDLILVTGLLAGYAGAASKGPLMALWLLAIGIFLLQMAVALAIEGENTPLNLVTAAAMYFTYCQAWVYICAKAHYLDVVKQKKLVWDKTVRSPRAT
jgi:cellulose synthase/poly-beta-1,6-N-acetylglucosamine synthase-like glycosyltransferase